MKLSAFFFLTLIFLLPVSENTSAQGKTELRTSEAILSVDQAGNMKIAMHTGGVVRVNASVHDLWKIVLKNRNDHQEYGFTFGKSVRLNLEENNIRMTCTGFEVAGRQLPVTAEFTVSVKEDAFCFSGTLKSESEEWIFRELNYPVISGIKVDDPRIDIYWPAGLGEHYSDPSVFGNKTVRYPGGSAGMAWFSLNAPDDGIYIGNHDPAQETKLMNLAFDKSSGTFSALINATVSGKEYSIPDVMVKPYKGEWYQAARYYRSWYDRNFTIVTPPGWVKDDAGWLLAILKQQNMEVMWPYPDIDKLCDVADRFNLGTIGLFGWAVGGHDHYYPNYPPDNLMGGRHELEKAIEHAHQRGKKIIIYANGKLMDTSTDFYRYNGFETMVVQANGQPDVQYYIKQKNGTPVIFAQACTGSEIWRKTMLDLGLQAVSLGADGILYDQVGGMGIYSCYAENHDHKPGLGDTPNRLRMIREIRQQVKKINPEFVVMTEDTNDKIMQDIDYHHGCATGSPDNKYGFPALIRYTFPELIITQRNPNPMITHTDANFAIINGLRHEIETRYPADREYLLNGTLPAEESYSNVVSPPNVVKMNLLPAKEATDYVHTLIGFENQNADFFRHGKFIARDGMEVSGEDIAANGFLNTNRIGVVVWNKNITEKRSFSVLVPGYKLIKSSEPGKTDVKYNESLDANSIRLLVFEKNTP